MRYYNYRSTVLELAATTMLPDLCKSFKLLADSFKYNAAHKLHVIRHFTTMEVVIVAL